MVINATFDNISHISSLSVTCDRFMASSANKTDRHDITEILLKVALNIINQIKPNHILFDQFEKKKNHVYDLTLCTNWRFKYCRKKVVQ